MATETVVPATDAALAEALRAFVENAAQAKDFALEQAPDVIQQLIAYNIASATVGAVGGAVLFWFSLGWFKKCRLLVASNNGSDELSGTFGCIGSVIVAALSFAWTYDAANLLLKLVFAPKVFLLEYAANLVR